MRITERADQEQWEFPIDFALPDGFHPVELHADAEEKARLLN